MKQDDGTGMNASGQLFESLLVGRLLILVPVYIGETQKNVWYPRSFAICRFCVLYFPCGGR